MDYNRNPYFRYQAIQKLGSVFSNHSNVFAVWITVGYFEVRRTTSVTRRDSPTQGTPTALNWARSWAATRATSSAIAAFYMFDRSIPVGFIRGQGHQSGQGRFAEEVYRVEQDRGSCPCVATNADITGASGLSIY